MAVQRGYTSRQWFQTRYTMHLPVQRTLTSMEWSQPWRPVGEKNLLHSSTVSLDSEQASWSRKMGPDPADTVGIVREAVDRTVVHGVQRAQLKFGRYLLLQQLLLTTSVESSQVHTDGSDVLGGEAGTTDGSPGIVDAHVHSPFGCASCLVCGSNETHITSGAVSSHSCCWIYRGGRSINSRYNTV